MTTFTGVADADGNFTLTFPTPYVGGQKITVSAEKSGATKSIELYAPSDLSGGGVFQFSGTLDNFPNNAGILTLSADINGVITEGTFNAQSYLSLWSKLTGLVIKGATSIEATAFYGWQVAISLSLPSTLISIGASAFEGWVALKSFIIPNSVTTIGDYAFRGCTACTSITLGSGLTSIGWNSFQDLTVCTEIISLATTPPVAGPSFLDGLKSTCKIKVPTASLAAYKAADNWKTHASKMIGI